MIATFIYTGCRGMARWRGSLPSSRSSSIRPSSVRESTPTHAYTPDYRVYRKRVVANIAQALFITRRDTPLDAENSCADRERTRRR